MLKAMLPATFDPTVRQPAIGPAVSAGARILPVGNPDEDDDETTGPAWCQLDRME